MTHTLAAHTQRCLKYWPGGGGSFVFSVGSCFILVGEWKGPCCSKMGLVQLHLLYVNHISTYCTVYCLHHVFDKYILNATDVLLGIVLGTRDTRASKRDRGEERDLDNKQLNIQ